MFERYTEKARRVIFFARYEASEFGSPYIETEFLLLGLLRESKHVVTRWLGEGDWQTILREEVGKRCNFGTRISTSVDLPLSDESKRVLAYAAEEADRLSHHMIGTEHVFLGLLREPESGAAQILLERGIEINAVRETLAKEGAEAPTRFGAVSQTPPPFHIEIALEDGEVLYVVPLPLLPRVPVVGETIRLSQQGSVEVTKVEWELHLSKVVLRVRRAAKTP